MTMKLELRLPTTDVVEGLEDAAKLAYLLRAEEDERQIRRFLTGRPLHEQVRVVLEVHPHDVRKLRVRDWSEMTLTEATRVAQGLAILNQENLR